MPRRRPQSRVVTKPRREYVFSQQATIHDLKAHLQEQLRKELAALQPDSLLNRNVDEILGDFIARYTLTVPVLDKAGIAEMPRQEIQMEVPRVAQNRVFAGPGPFYVPATSTAGTPDEAIAAQSPTCDEPSKLSTPTLRNLGYSDSAGRWPRALPRPPASTRAR
jgi:hypothetical protein